MAQAKVSGNSITLQVKNIGGITETTVDLSPGVTVLTGRNATNRTSLLRAIMAALGSDDATVKGEADEGYVEMTIGDTTYTRRLSQENGTISTSGDPYLEGATIADLFAFLLETNDARQAVAREDDLRELIMRPVDTDEIEREIDRYRSERDDIDRQLENIRQLARKLPDLESEKSQLEKEINEKKEELQTVEAEIEEIDENDPEKDEQKNEYDEKFEKLKDARSELESLRRDLETQRESLDALKTEREELETDREEYDEVPNGRINDIETDIQRLRDQKDRINSTINDLQTVIEFNEDLLDGSLDIFSDLHEDGENTEAVTDQLLEDSDELVCWTCGNETETAQIETMVERLRDLHEQHMEERRSIDEQIDELNEKRHQLEEKKRQRKQIETRIENVSEEIEDREEKVTELKEEKGDLADQIETLETEVEELEEEDDSDNDDNELLKLHKEANRLEVDIDQLEADFESVTEEIERIENRVNEREDLEDQREEIQQEIEALRDKVETLEQGAVTAFNTHMESILDILSYENLERIWIERTEEEVREGRQTVTKGRFTLHIVRSSESGSVYEDTINHLSESEREVTGLVFALAGYLVHDVHEIVPFMILDSVEAIDAGRLSDLIDYFQEHAKYLVVALLEEDAQALSDEHHRITEI